MLNISDVGLNMSESMELSLAGQGSPLDGIAKVVVKQERIDPKKVTNSMIQKILSEHLQTEVAIHGLVEKMTWDGQDKINEIDISGDAVCAELQDILQKMTGNPLSGKCRSAVKVLLNSPKKVNHFRDELGKLEKVDGTSEIEKFVRCVSTTKNFNWSMELWSHCFTGLVAYQYDDTNRSCQVTPILLGPTGIGKSEVGKKILGAVGLQPTAYKGFPNTKSPDEISKLLDAPLVELSEISSTSKKQNEDIKTFMTERVQKWRRYYTKTPVTVVKSTMYIGTTNNHQIFSDKTGNRRFFVVDFADIYSHCKDRYEIAHEFQSAINTVDFKKILAEAKNLFESGFKWYASPSNETSKLNDEHNKRFTIGSDQEHLVWEKRWNLSGRTLKKMDIYRACGISVPKNTKNPQFDEFLMNSGLIEKSIYWGGYLRFKFRDLKDELALEEKEKKEMEAQENEERKVKQAKRLEECSKQEVNKPEVQSNQVEEQPLKLEETMEPPVAVSPMGSGYTDAELDEAYKAE